MECKGNQLLFTAKDRLLAPLPLAAPLQHTLHLFSIVEAAYCQALEDHARLSVETSSRKSLPVPEAASTTECLFGTSHLYWQLEKLAVTQFVDQFLRSIPNVAVDYLYKE